MASGLLILEILTYGPVLWLGLYLIARNPANPRLRYAGLGLVAYALSLASKLLVVHASTPTLALILSRLHWPMLFLPALFWLGAMVYLLPEETSIQVRLSQVSGG
ncbi:MAG: hypothetical protein P8186_20095 [Anaerolineae bacterium]|jgi:hypothetical protein